MIVSVRSRAMAWTLAGLAALTVVVALVVAAGGGGDETGEGAVPGNPGAAETSVSGASRPDPAPGSGAVPPSPATSTTNTSAPSTTTTSAPSTTTTAVPATTTTAVPASTTTAPPVLPSSDYTPLPKPTAGPDTVAPGGALTKHLAADIATAFGFATAAVEAAIAGAELPPEAAASPEGWLAPGAYERAAGVFRSGRGAARSA